MSETEQHLWCTACETQPTVARLDSRAKIVCSCTHVDGEIEPLGLNEMETMPNRWEFVPHGAPK